MSALEVVVRVLESVGLGVLAGMAVIALVRVLAFVWILLFGRAVRVVVHRPDGSKVTVRRTVPRGDDFVEFLDDVARRGR